MHRWGGGNLGREGAVEELRASEQLSHKSNGGGQGSSVSRPRPHRPATFGKPRAEHQDSGDSISRLAPRHMGCHVQHHSRAAPHRCFFRCRIDGALYGRDETPELLKSVQCVPDFLISRTMAFRHLYRIPVQPDADADRGAPVKVQHISRNLKQMSAASMRACIDATLKRSAFLGAATTAFDPPQLFCSSETETSATRRAKFEHAEIAGAGLGVQAPAHLSLHVVQCLQEQTLMQDWEVSVDSAWKNSRTTC